MNVWRRWGVSMLFASLLELLLYFPVVLIVFVYKSSGSLSLPFFVFLLLIGYWIGCGIHALLKFRHPFPKLLLGILVTGGFIPIVGFSVQTILLLLLIVCSIYRGSRLTGIAFTARLNTGDYFVGVCLYFVGSIVQSVWPVLEQYQPLYLTAGLLTLFTVLFLTNGSMVGRETLSGTDGPTVEPSVRRNNRLFVSVALIIAVLIALSYQLQAWFGKVGHVLKNWLNRLFSGLGGEQELPTQPNLTPAPSWLTPPKETQTIPTWIEYIFYGIVIALAVWLLFLLVRRVGLLPGWLRELGRKFLHLFQRQGDVLTRGYVDEVESIKKSQRSMRKWLGRGKGKEERIKWRDLSDNEARLRYLYRRWVGAAVRKGFRHQSHMTPQEIKSLLGKQGTGAVSPALSETLVGHYEQVRYGNGKLTNEQLQSLAAQLGQKNG